LGTTTASSLLGAGTVLDVLNRTAVDALLERAHREVDEGLLPGCQVALAMNGEVEVFESYGDATADTRYVVFSCTKPIVASAIWLLLAEGAVDLGEKVTTYLPGFGTNGKDVITLEQVMVHTGGFPHAPMGPRHWSTHETRLGRYAEWRLNWEPGTASAYHPSSAHWVLADVVQAVTGADYRAFVRDRISVPLGLPRMQLGVPEGEQADIAPLLDIGEPMSDEEWKAATGNDHFDLGEVTQQNLVALHNPAALAVGHPGGGLVSTAADLALFYQALLHNPGGLWDAAILEDATSKVRHTLSDKTLMIVANRTLGLMVAGDDGLAAWRGMGRTASPRTFGHNGAGGEIAWADPDTGLSFCYATNGLDANLLRHGRRGVALSSRAAVTPQ
jgi:CubicO group peptidase (beta-lactamase class C family)